MKKVGRLPVSSLGTGMAAKAGKKLKGRKQKIKDAMRKSGIK